MSYALPINYDEAERIHQAAVEKGWRSILLTSAVPGEGTSTIAYALAQRLVAGGRRVLLVDFNDATSYAESDLALERDVWDLDPRGRRVDPFVVPGSGLSILPAPIGGFSAISCRDEAVARLALEDWYDRYDMVVGDAPSFAPTVRGGMPTEVLARAFDAVMLVVLSDATPGNAVQSAVRRLRDARAEIAGIVLNDREMPPLRDELLRQFRKLGRRGAPLAAYADRLLGRIGAMSVDF